MHPIRGFEPLVSVVSDDLKFFCFWIPPTNLVEVRAQDAREARRLLAAQKKDEKDAAKKRQVRKALE
jgi:hypothetical protein